MDVDTQLDSVLKGSGHRLTRPRRLVWDVLRTSDRHLTAEEVAQRVNEVDPGVNLASVYRSLALFAELDLARESRLGDETASRWEEAHPDDHFHLMCRSCGTVRHHAGDLVQGVREHLGSDHGFAADTIDLVVTGTCRECRTA